MALQGETPSCPPSCPIVESNEEPLLHRDHSWPSCIFMVCGLAMCITVDILQYSMPLAFLPSVLEDRGHSPLKIATAIGVYYWTGFAGGLLITSYKIIELVFGKPMKREVTTVPETKRRIWYLVIGLGVGAVTLMMQAMYPHCWMHTACRFLQGLAGAFIFFYTFLLCVCMFKGPQQVFAMTAATTALNIAEVLGSSVGALLFNSYGQRSVFWFLGVVSILNQVFLIAIIAHLRVGIPSLVSSRTPSIQSAGEIDNPDHRPTTPIQDGDVRPLVGCAKLMQVMRSQRLACAVLLIVMAAIVKGAVEEMLPFHADHRWGFEPLKIGKLFSIIALGYISAAMCCGRVWTSLQGFQVMFSAFWLMVLGCMAWATFLAASYCKQENILWAGLLTYGVCLGLTHTPAALLLADAIDHEEGRAKDAVNGIWNTMWEAGGSLGFLLGGLLAEDYAGQLRLLTGCCITCIFGGVVMLIVAPRETQLSWDLRKQQMLKASGGYGSTSA